MRKGKATPKKVILLVAFGTGVPEAAKALDEIDAKVREKYQGTEVRWAFTSRTIRSRLAAEGKHMDSPETALSRLMEEGFTHAALLSLHVVPGEEFHDLWRNAMRFSEMSAGFEKVVVARPLLGNYDDMFRVAGILSEKNAGQSPGEGVLFIGHGNARHPSDAIYIAMNSLLMDRGPFYAGTVQGHPTPAELLPKLKSAKLRKLKLIPLMTVAGDHARKDMAGDDPGSWKSILSENGIECEAVFQGLAQEPEVVQVWLDHLEEAFSKL
ncbi:MAG: sirohydrochlorin cobaltochelatase [Syntrophobacteraceae bacterium]